MSVDGVPTGLSPSLQVARLMDGCLVTQLLYIVAKLDIAGALADGPRTAGDLAMHVGVDPTTLRRVLRGLASEGVFEELPDDRFGLTALGECLRDGVPGSLRGAITARRLVFSGRGWPPRCHATGRRRV